MGNFGVSGDFILVGDSRLTVDLTIWYQPERVKLYFTPLLMLAGPSIHPTSEGASPLTSGSSALPFSSMPLPFSLPFPLPAAERPLNPAMGYGECCMGCGTVRGRDKAAKAILIVFEPRKRV